MHTDRFRPFRGAVASAVILLTCLPALAETSGTWTFVDVTQDAGLYYDHGFPGGPTNDSERTSAGAAAGDFDGDGWLDLYVSRGAIEPNMLFRNKARRATVRRYARTL